MSFFLATVTTTSGGLVVSDPRAARLGSPTGFLATYIAALGSAAEKAWSISAAEAVAGTGGDPSGDVLFFRPSQEPGEALEFYRLESIHGISTSERTDLVFHFQPVAASVQNGGTWGVSPGPHRELAESLSLTGGTAGGQWRWTDPPMAIGSATVGGSTCSCGRAPAPA